MKAFPTHDNCIYTDPRERILSGGMDLRDWFAGMALQGMNASPALFECMTHASIIEGEHFSKLAINAYKQADAMLEARKVKGE